MQAFLDLLDLMRRLRGPDGCPWDKAQDFNSLAPYTIEESYELVASIEARDWAEFQGELGDLLFHVVFYAQIAAENGLFTMEDVARAVVDKMRRRHPHVFGDTPMPTAPDLHAQWQATKAQERAARQETQGAWDEGIPSALPALHWAYKLQQRAVNHGFEWQSIDPVWEKVEEELVELRQASMDADQAHIQEELGDVLFSMVNLSRFLEVHPEQALREACVKFRTRLDLVCGQARQAGMTLRDLDEAELENLWQSAKAELEKRKRNAGEPA